jgi:hypothetical protein
MEAVATGETAIVDTDHHQTTDLAVEVEDVAAIAVRRRRADVPARDPEVAIEVAIDADKEKNIKLCARSSVLSRVTTSLSVSNESVRTKNYF